MDRSKSALRMGVAGIGGLVSALGLLLAGCGGGGSPPAQTARIVGYIVDQPGGSVVEGATVMLQRLPQAPVTTTTGRDGRFEFSGLETPTGEMPHLYSITVTKPQWATVTSSVTVRKAETYRITLVQPILDSRFATDATLPTLNVELHVGGDLSVRKYDVTASDPGSGLRFVGWLIDYDWGHLQGTLLDGETSHSETFTLPDWALGPDDHTSMIIAIDRAGNTRTFTSSSHRSFPNPFPAPTSPNLIGAVAFTATSSFAVTPPTYSTPLSGMAGVLSRDSLRKRPFQLSRNPLDRLLQQATDTLRQELQKARRTGSPRPQALPPNSDGFLFTILGWTQPDLTNVNGFSIYCNGERILDYPTTGPEGITEYRLSDLGAQLVPGQTAMYTVRAYNQSTESTDSNGRSVVPLGVLPKPAATAPGNYASLGSLPRLEWSPVPGQSTHYLVEILAPGAELTSVWEGSSTGVDMSTLQPPSQIGYWPAGTYSWRPLVFRSTPDYPSVDHPEFDYEAISIGAGDWRTFTLTGVN